MTYTSKNSCWFGLLCPACRLSEPLGLDVPVRILSRSPKSDILVPAVSHEVWSLDDGRLGVVFVNLETEPRQLDVDLSPLIVKDTTPVVREVSTQGGQRKRSLPNFRLKIPALDMLLLELTGE